MRLCLRQDRPLSRKVTEGGTFDHTQRNRAVLSGRQRRRRGCSGSHQLPGMRQLHPKESAMTNRIRVLER